jgi:two-component system, NarL family, response regulator DevR
VLTVDDDAPITRVVVIDDHDVLASGLAHVMASESDLECVGVANTLEDGRKLLTEHAPDVLLLDQGLPDGDGVSAIPEILKLQPRLRIVVLTANATDSILVRAIENGAAGFVAKNRSLREVLSAVRAAASGEAVISSELLARLLPRLTGESVKRHEDLTDREREVLVLLAEGLTNVAIAERLVVSVHTVRNHVANLSSKLGAHSKLEALSIAVRDGLLPDRL